MRRLARMGHEALLLPLAEPFHLLEEARRALEETEGAIALTSAEAVRVLAVLGADLKPHLARPIFTVGKATAAEAAELGFEVVAMSDGGGTELASVIADHRPSLGNSPLLYLAGLPLSLIHI